MKTLPLSLLASLAPCLALAQQAPDTTFRHDNPDPAYAMGEGPRVCVDGGHNNFHTADHRFRPFAELLRGDGYRVESFGTKFNRSTLAACAILVIANPDAAEETPWAFPHAPAFEREEITDLIAWLREGGSLFLLVDHQPVPGVAKDLGFALGAAMLDGVADPNPGEGIPDMFTRESGTLKPHPILKGRKEGERVDSVATFTGHSFFPSLDYEPLLVMGPRAINYVDLEEQGDVPRAEWPRFRAAGWLQGGARRWGAGRIVVLGEAAMCTAQRVGDRGRPIGMNHPKAVQNAQFCLNVIRWLDGVLNDD